MAMPDFSQPLDTQICPLSQEGLTWQQFFLGKALEHWTVLQALRQKSLQYVEREEEYFEPDPEKHEKYMTGMPILPILYSKDATFHLNEKEQAYLDGIPEQLEQLAEDLGYESGMELAQEEFGASLMDVQHVAELLNYGYFYYISHTFDLEFSEVQLAKASRETEKREDPLVTLRQILILPSEGETAANGKITADPESWEAAEEEADAVLKSLLSTIKARKGTCDEAEFAQKAHDISADTGSRISGGLYSRVKKGQLPEQLETWAFQEEREPADTVILKSEYGIHILFFCSRETEQELLIEKYLLNEHMERVMDQVMEGIAPWIAYERIELYSREQPGKVSMERDLLYRDIGYERFTEVPVYLQQDYMNAPYAAGYKVGTHGCGITSFAMLATYMTDSRMTPGSCARDYPQYGSSTGTDSRIFVDIPPLLGFFMDKRAGLVSEVAEALEEGKKAISVQRQGHFTRGGHYLVLTEMTEDHKMVIRDSNIYNFSRVPEHRVDKCSPSLVAQNCHGFWIFDNKVITIPGCSRCGEQPESGFMEDYICPKCRGAMNRRESFLELCHIS